jgi:hypothetical protein
MELSSWVLKFEAKWDQSLDYFVFRLLLATRTFHLTDCYARVQVNLENGVVNGDQTFYSYVNRETGLRPFMLYIFLVVNKETISM